MIPATHRISRYRLAVDRVVAKRNAALAALALVPGVACGSYDDAAVFRSATTVTENASETLPPADVSDAEVPSTSAEAPSGEAPSPTVPATTTAPATAPITDPTTTTTVAASADVELAVSFTFTPTAGGRRIENPYIAVWIEDADGNLVKTVSLWYEQSSEGPEWLSHLARWSTTTDGEVDATTSGATRVAGEYSVMWDGTDGDGATVAPGDYVVFVEAARRGGAYDLTAAPITIGAGGVVVELPDSGELTGVSAELIA